MSEFILLFQWLILLALVISYFFGDVILETLGDWIKWMRGARCEMSEELKPIPWRKWPKETPSVGKWVYFLSDGESEKTYLDSDLWWSLDAIHEKFSRLDATYWCYESDILATLPKEGEE